MKHLIIIAVCLWMIFFISYGWAQDALPTSPPSASADLLYIGISLLLIGVIAGIVKGKFRKHLPNTSFLGALLLCLFICCFFYSFAVF